jgi:glycosyltransferase involved in cell wall biosynthesis
VDYAIALARAAVTAGANPWPHLSGLAASHATPTVSTDALLTPPISVIIPARNEAPRLGACLRSVELSLKEARLVGAEVVVIDDDSDDETAAVAGAGGATVLQQSPRRGPLAAWVLGVRATSSPCLVFIDADCQVSSNALAALLASLARPGVGVVAGRSQPTGPDNPTGIVERAADFSGLLLHEIKSRLGNHDFLPIGRLMAVRRAAWQVEDGGLVPCDRVVATLAKGAGWAVVYAPEAVALYQRLSTYRALREDYVRTSVARRRRALEHDSLPPALLWRAAWASAATSPGNALAWAACRAFLAAEKRAMRQPPYSPRWPP